MNADDSFSSSSDESSLIATTPPLQPQFVSVQPSSSSSVNQKSKKRNPGLNPTCNHRLASLSKDDDDSDEEDDLFPLIDSKQEQQTFRLSLNKNKRSRQEFWLVCKAYFAITFLMTALVALFFLFFNHLILNSNGSTSITNQQRPQDDDNNLTKSNSSISTYQINLDIDDHFHLFWSPDYLDETILFELKLKLKTNYDWFAFGFSDHGSIANADLCLIWTDKRRRLHLEDAKTDNDSMVIIKNHHDHQSNDCQFIKSKHDRQQKMLYVAFRRYFDTCDPDDYQIDNGTTHMVYVTGRGPLSRSEGLHLIDYQHGFQRAQLLKPPPLNSKSKTKISDEQLQTLDFLVDNVTIPNVETTYWCTLIKLPETFKQRIHIVQYEAIINEQNKDIVHHMELFHCEVDAKKKLPPWNGLCHDSNMPELLEQCKRVTAAWAYGAGPMIYPENVGLPVGGENYSLYAMIEVHYNNPEMKAGSVDNSGIRIHYTKRLRPIESGILEIGLEYIDKNSIPPNTLMESRGYCVSECTRVGLPPNGITIFASQLHTHLTGVGTWTEHVRGGIQLPDLNRDNHYSPHFQEIRKLPNGGVHVYPGDALINVCRYDTRKRTRMTFGGYGISDEMCVNYLHYYPRSNLEVCKSSIDTDHLMKYFETMRINENQNTSIHYSVADNFNNIHWTPYRIQKLNQLYQTAPLSVQCNQSSGQRFPGYWNGIPLTTVIQKPIDQAKNATNNRCRWVLKKFHPINGDDENDFDDDDDERFMDNDDDSEYDDNDAMNTIWYRRRQHQRRLQRKWKQLPSKLKRSDFNDHSQMIV
uniref:Dopamine beta-hydroxylase-like n=1 Tax=Dermatophagoides pteronyssinus TaxID=6956 RepID=A0A6P6Y0T5_DERPT|nr:dopamine beta-hydroxylase-like [Dermatophagoides pteronyssinus]